MIFWKLPTKKSWGCSFRTEKSISTKSRKKRRRKPRSRKRSVTNSRSALMRQSRRGKSRKNSSRVRRRQTVPSRIYPSSARQQTMSKLHNRISAIFLRIIICWQKT